MFGLGTIDGGLAGLRLVVASDPVTVDICSSSFIECSRDNAALDIDASEEAVPNLNDPFLEEDR